MVRQYPGRRVVFGVAPPLAVALQFSLAVSHGIPLGWPATFALVVAVGVPVTMRQYLVEFRLEQRYRAAGLDGT